MEELLVSVIIVNWNGKRFLKDCLGSLSSISYRNIEIILVDNASTDSSVEYVRRNFPSVVIVRNKTNVGVSEGHDIGLNRSRGKAILLLNNDTIVERDLFNALVHVLYSDNNIGAVQPKLVLYPQKNLIDSIGSFLLTTGDLYHIGREKNPDDPRFNKSMEIFSTKGACMLIKREVLEKTGLFDANFYAYFEDTDLSIRIWLAGYKIVYTPYATVYHRGGGGSKQIKRSHILYHAYKNRIYSYLKNFSWKYVLKIFPVMLCMYQVAFLGYLATGEFAYALAVQRGILWNVIHLSEIIKKRKQVQQNIRVIADDVFIPPLTRRVKPSYYFYQFFGGIEKYND